MCLVIQLVTRMDGQKKMLSLSTLSITQRNRSQWFRLGKIRGKEDPAELDPSPTLRND